MPVAKPRLFANDELSGPGSFYHGLDAIVSPLVTEGVKK